MEKPASRLARAATQQPRRRPRLCKRCAVSARQRNCRSSFECTCFFEFPRRDNFLGQRFEARLTAQVVKHWIYPDGIDVIAGAFAIRSLQRVDSVLLVA